MKEKRYFACIGFNGTDDKRIVVFERDDESYVSNYIIKRDAKIYPTNYHTSLANCLHFKNYPYFEEIFISGDEITKEDVFLEMI
jgi:hypothetical protein